MAEDRRYRQMGYKDSDRDRRDGRPAPRTPGSDGPRPPGMLPTRSVSRCGACGTLLPPLTEPSAVCPQCRTPLHACRQCAHFDPGRRFECAQPVTERIADKDARNECAHFALRVTIERDASGGGGTASPPPRPDDARRAFDNLFKR
jgi:hypothetical protein